eukprot:scaffold110630_cov22-Tisochrysis_lutea.AAC.1
MERNATSKVITTLRQLMAEVQGAAAASGITASDTEVVDSLEDADLVLATRAKLKNSPKVWRAWFGQPRGVGHACEVQEQLQKRQNMMMTTWMALRCVNNLEDGDPRLSMLATREATSVPKGVASICTYALLLSYQVQHS